MFKSIFRLWGTKKPAVAEFKGAVSISADDRELRDRYASAEEFASSITATGMFLPEFVGWMAKEASERIKGGSDSRTTLAAIVRQGQLLTPEELKALGLNPRRKLGRDFACAIAHHDAKVAIERLELSIQVTASTANTLHDLRRKRESGITHCQFVSPRDERATPLERELDGKRMSVDEAANLTKERGAEIFRSWFRTEIKL